MSSVWRFIKWIFGYDPKFWAPLLGFLKLWLIAAAIMGILFIGLYLSGATFERID